MHRVLNASNILGTISFLAMITAIAACEGGMYITSVVLVAIFAGCAYLSIKENGQKK